MNLDSPSLSILCNAAIIPKSTGVALFAIAQVLRTLS